MAALSKYLRFVRWELLILISLPVLRFLLEIGGVPFEFTEPVSIWLFQLLLIVVLPFKLVRYNFGGYFSLWGLIGLCCLIGFEVVALLVGINYLYPMHTYYAENAAAHLGYSSLQHVLAHIFITPVFTTITSGVIATPIYLLARGIWAQQTPIHGTPVNYTESA